MNNKYLQFAAIIIIELMLFLPISTVEALQITHGPNPSTVINDSAAVIEWSTDEPSHSQVSLGLSPALGTERINADLTTFHSIQLANLSPNTRYYFQLFSIAASGDNALDDNNGRYYSFVTRSDVDSIAPELTNITIIALTATTATVQWKTNEAATSIVYIGEVGQPTNRSNEMTDLVTTHVMTMPAEDGKKYNYILESCDRYNNCRQSEPQFLVGGADLDPPEINVNIPEWHHSGRIDFIGTTEPFASVDLYINGERKRTLPPQFTGETGAINFQNVALPLDENNVTITAKDQANNNASISGIIKIDSIPPTLIVSGLVSPSINPSQTLKINLSEPATITFDIGVIDTTPPKKVINLTTKQVGSTLVELAWGQNNEEDLDEYAVYRKESNVSGADWIRMGVNKRETYQDTKIQSGKTYFYKVSAIDKRCNEGVFSDTLSVTLPAGASISTRAISTSGANLSCQKKVDRLVHDGGSFDKVVQFDDGENEVVITAVDRAGHSVVYRNKTVYDKYPPEILSHNLDKLSPTYIPTVTVAGNVSKKSAVSILINGELIALEETDASGGFSITFDLPRGDPLDEKSISIHVPLLSALAGDTFDAGSAGPTWINNVTLIATSLSGTPSQPVYSQVVMASCGFGSDYRVDIGGQPASIYGSSGLSPSILNPRMMIEGDEIISFPINITYIGDGEDQILGAPSVIKYVPNQAVRDQYEPDVDWTGEAQVICDPKTQKTCLVQIPVRVPDSYFDGKFEGHAQEDNVTMYMKEELISKNRIDECISGVNGQGFGCIKIPMMLEIRFKDVRERTGAYQGVYYPDQQRIESKTQKQCWNLEIAIDQRLPTDLIPGGLLAGAEGFLNSTINVIDAVLEPLKKVKEYMLYSCMVSWVLAFFTSVSHQFSCGGDDSIVGVASTIAKAASESSFDLRIAEAGLCSEAYKSTSDPDDSDRKESCESCESSLKWKSKLEWFMHHTCDSIFCPKAPTLQTYIKSQISKVPKEITIEGLGTHYVSGSSCACALTGDGKKCNPVKESATPVTNLDTMKKVYEWYKQNPKMGSSTGVGLETCVGPHTARPECCGFEYMREWGSACGVPFFDETGFSEIKESLCISNEGSNNPSKIEGVTLSSDSQQGDDTVTCSPTLNSIAGFCESDGSVSLDPISTSMQVSPSKSSSPQIDKENLKLHVCLKPAAQGSTSNYNVNFCYATTKNVYDKANSNNALSGAGANFITVQKEFGFYLMNGGDVSNTFVDPSDDAGTQKGKLEFCSKMAPFAANYDKNACEDKYTEIQNMLGDPNKQYVVEPTSSFIRTIQCLCISGLESYLTLWRKVFSALMNCFRTIRVTGDGSPGVCQATVSVYICDLIFDIIKCFTNKYGSGPGTRADTGVSSTGGFISAMTNGGSAVSDSVSGRYGDSNLWEAMFVEQKLMHAVCLWAFTGVWDFDMTALLESGSALPPVKSIGLLSPCEARYRSFNPVSNPKGLTTWIYHFGAAIIPGADLRYTLKLVCSDDYSCYEPDGFERGRCDCRDGEKTLIVSDSSLPGTLSQSGTLDTEIFFKVEAKEQRYDKAILEWEWEDGEITQKDKAECDISVRGGNPPAFCGFDIGNGIYRCSFGFESANWIQLNSVQPAYVLGQPAFKIGETIKFNVNVQQSIPLNPDCVGSCDYTKFMTYEIVDSSQKVKKSSLLTEGAKPLQTSGQQIIDNFPQFTLDQAFFDQAGLERAVETRCIQGIIPSGWVDPQICMPSGSCENICIGSYKVGVSGQSSKNVNLVLAMNEKGEYKFFVPNAATEPDDKTGADINNNYWGKATQPRNKGLDTPTDIKNGRTFTYEGLTFTIFGQASQYSEILFVYNGQTGATSTASTGCAQYATYDLAKQKPFTVNYKIYDSKQLGGRYELSDQISQFNGQNAQGTTQFIAVCSSVLTPSNTGLNRQCAVRSETAETAACWCSDKSRADSAFSTSSVDFDCGRGNEINIDKEFCVDNYCTDLPACKMDATVPLSKECVCSVNNGQETKCGGTGTANLACYPSGECKEPIFAACSKDLNEPLKAKCACLFGTGASKKNTSCIIGEVCDIDRLYENAQSTTSIYRADSCMSEALCASKDTKLTENCWCVDALKTTANLCGANKYCCQGLTGKCVSKPEECPENVVPKVDWDNAHAITLDGKTGPFKFQKDGENYVVEVQSSPSAELEYKIVFDVAHSRNYGVESTGRTAYQGTYSSNQAVSDLKFKIASNEQGKQFDNLISVFDTTEKRYIDTKKVTVKVKGLEGTPVLNFGDVWKFDNSKWAHIVPASDGSYYLESGKSHNINLDVANVGILDTKVSHIIVGPGAVQQVGTIDQITPAVLDQIRQLFGQTPKYQWWYYYTPIKGTPLPYDLSITLCDKNNCATKTVTKNLKITEFNPVTITNKTFLKNGLDYTQTTEPIKIGKSEEFELNVKYINFAKSVEVWRKGKTDIYEKVTDITPIKEGASLTHIANYKAVSTYTAGNDFNVGEEYTYELRVYNLDNTPVTFSKKMIVTEGEGYTVEGIYMFDKKREAYWTPSDNADAGWTRGTFFIDNTEDYFIKIHIPESRRLASDFRIKKEKDNDPFTITWVNDPKTGKTSDGIYYAKIKANSNKVLHMGKISVESTAKGTNSWKSGYNASLYISRIYFVLMRDGFKTVETGSNKCLDSDADVLEFWFGSDAETPSKDACVYLEPGFAVHSGASGRFYETLNKRFDSRTLSLQEYGEDSFPAQLVYGYEVWVDAKRYGLDYGKADDGKEDANFFCKRMHQSFMFGIVPNPNDKPDMRGKLYSKIVTWSLLTSKVEGTSSSIIPKVSGGKNVNEVWPFIAVMDAKNGGTIAERDNNCDTWFT